MIEMKQISRYAYANTRIRAMVSKLLDEEFFIRAETLNLQSFIELLEKTYYGDIIKKFDRQLKIEDFEIMCINKDRQLLKKIFNILWSKNEKHLIFLLDEKYRIEQLKFVLRLWKKNQGTDIPEMTGEFSMLLKAKSIDDIIDLIDDKEYKEAIKNSKDAFLSSNCLYPVEVSIDRKYFEKLLKAIERLSSADRVIARRIIGAQIDRENLMWLGRIKLYYEGKIPEEFSGFIPGGTLSEKHLKMLLSQSFSEQYTGIPRQYVDIVAGLPEKLSEIDSVLEGIIMHEVKKAFVEGLFTIGVPVGYIFLKLRETKKVISFLAKKYYATFVYQ